MDCDFSVKTFFFKENFNLVQASGHVDDVVGRAQSWSARATRQAFKYFWEPQRGDEQSSSYQYKMIWVRFSLRQKKVGRKIVSLNFCKCIFKCLFRFWLTVNFEIGYSTVNVFSYLCLKFAIYCAWLGQQWISLKLSSSTRKKVELLKQLYNCTRIQLFPLKEQQENPLSNCLKIFGRQK